MKALVTLLVSGLLGVVAAPGAMAQGPAGTEARLKEKNIVLPTPNPPVANYVGTVWAGNLLFVSGHTSNPQWTLKGKVGKDLTVDQGAQAARQAGLNFLHCASDAWQSRSR